jgi:pimeloyl-ACP methyl ester carboxylesterase
VGGFVDDRRRVLASAHADVDFRVIAGAGHWVVYEAAGEVNALIADMLPS